MDNRIWKEERSALGVTVTLEVVNRGGRIILIGSGSGFGCTLGPREVELTGNRDHEFSMGSCSGTSVFGFVRISNWRRSATFLSLDLGAWGKVGGLPWAPAGGSWFKVAGPLQAPATAAELGEYLQGAYADDLREHGIAVPDEEPAAAAV